MNCGLLCGLFMVKHHGLIITDVAVWILPFNQDPNSRNQIIRCCCVVPFPELSHYRRGLSGIHELGGLFLILRHQNLQKANITFNKNMGIAVCFLNRSSMQVIRRSTLITSSRGQLHIIGVAVGPLVDHY